MERELKKGGGQVRVYGKRIGDRKGGGGGGVK